MRVGLIFVLTVVSATAWAEKVKTNQDTKVLNHPGEQGKVIVKVKSGQNMTVLAKEGRWIKVRVSGRTGYVPRSKVDMADDDEIVRNTRRRPFVDGRGTKRGFGTDQGPDDRVGADATGNGDDDDSGAKKPAAKAGDDDDDKPGKKPAKKPAAKGGDDDDDKPGKPAKKPAAKGGHGDDDDDDDKPAKKPAKKPAAKGGHGDDDDDDDKPAKKPAKKPAAKGGHGDDDDDDDKPAKKPAKKPAAKGGHGDDDDDDKPAKKSAKGGDDDDATVSDDDDKTDDKTDDKAEDAPAEKRITAHVAAKTKIFSERDEESEVAFVAKPADMLYPADTKGQWTMVETDEGDAGWTLTSGLEVEDDGGGDMGGPRVREIGLHAGAGLMFLQQGMRGTGGTPATPPAGFNVDNYDIGTSAATISLGGQITWPYKKKYILGVEASLDYASTVFGGINVTVGTVTANTGVSIADYNLRGLAGYDFHKKNGMVLYGRLGIRYRDFSVDGYSDPTKNPAKLPQEVLKAPTLGVALVIPRLTPKVGLTLSLDTILFGSSVTQTVGLEDGASPSMSDYNIGGRFVYRWKKDMDLVGTYNLDYGSYDFGGPSMQSTRGHSTMDTDTTRTDISHMLTFGIIRAL